MAYENKPMTGVLYKNDRKEKDSHPDYKGTFYDAQLGERWFDAWINVSANGTTYMKVQVGDMKQNQSQAQNAPQSAPAAPKPVESEDIPF